MGHFDIFVQDAKGYNDADFISAQKNGTIDNLLASLPVKQEVHTNNLVLQMFSVCMFRKVFEHGLPNGSYPMDQISTGIPFSNILISSDSSEPNYSDWYGAYVNIHEMAYSVNTSNAAKYFVTSDLSLNVAIEASGKEGIVLRERWLYLPSEVISNEIRSIDVFWAEIITTGVTDRGMVARVRMKDSGGNPITLSKSADQTLLIQYSISLISI